MGPEAYQETYAHVFDANKRWNEIETSAADCFAWDASSTYIANPPFFTELTKDLPKPEPLRNLTVLAKLADSVTTDHISPAGNIAMDSPAGHFMKERQVALKTSILMALVVAITML